MITVILKETDLQVDGAAVWSVDAGGYLILHNGDTTTPVATFAPGWVGVAFQDSLPGETGVSWNPVRDPSSTVTINAERQWSPVHGWGGRTGFSSPKAQTR